MILVFTGNGKGKTTAAIGSAIRSIGWKKKTAMVFFDKGGEHYGEQKIFGFLKKFLDIFRFGAPRFDARKKTFRSASTLFDRREAKRALQTILKLFKKKYFLIIADEIISCLSRGLLEASGVQSVVSAARGTKTHLILTGRNAPAWLVKKADLVTEMKEKKHYFKKGQSAIEGIEF